MTSFSMRITSVLSYRVTCEVCGQIYRCDGDRSGDRHAFQEQAEASGWRLCDKDGEVTLCCPTCAGAYPSLHEVDLDSVASTEDGAGFFVRCSRCDRSIMKPTKAAVVEIARLREWHRDKDGRHVCSLCAVQPEIRRLREVSHAPRYPFG